MKALVEETLQKLMTTPATSYAALFEAARYSLFSSGKRIRPLLVLATVKVFGDELEKALLPACAIELIHTYSLIHDDLPCMDNDDFRRGKPTLHKVYPEWHALLTGDFLLTHAFEIIAKSPGLSAEQKLQLTHTLAKRAGGHGMVGGQFLDLESDGQTLQLPQLELLHRMKTGELLVACIEFGAIISNANSADGDKLKKFGKKIGLAFQIIDDVLDVTASFQKHGKLMGTDLLNKKTTYVNLLGVEKCRQTASQLLQEALELLFEIKGNTDLLREMAYSIVMREL